MKKPEALGESKSAEEAGARRAKRGSTTLQLDRMTPTTALALFGLVLLLLIQWCSGSDFRKEVCTTKS